MIINISKVLKLSLFFAVCTGQGVYADQTRAMAFAKNFVRVLPADQVAIMAAGLWGAIGGLYEARKDDWINKVGCVGIGALTTLGASILLNRQNPEMPASLFGSVGGALNFLGAQNFNQCLAYGAVAAGCGFANPALREIITQNPKLAGGFAGAAVLGKIAHLKIRDRRAAARREEFDECRRANGGKIKSIMSQIEIIPWVEAEIRQQKEATATKIQAFARQAVARQVVKRQVVKRQAEVGQKEREKRYCIEHETCARGKIDAEEGCLFLTINFQYNSEKLRAIGSLDNYKNETKRRS